MPRKPAPPDVSFLSERGLPSRVFAGSVGDPDQARQLDLALLDDNPFQPRETRDEDQLGQLAEVIGEQGFQGSLVARVNPDQPQRYQLAFGHRRRDAARAAGLRAVPVQVRELSDNDMVEIAITENIQREDLTPLAEGRTYLLMRQQLGYTQEQIATAIGKKRGYVANRVRLAQAPLDVQEFVSEKPDTIRAAATLVQIDDPATRAALMDQLRAGAVTTNDLLSFRHQDAGAMANAQAPAAGVVTPVTREPSPAPALAPTAMIATPLSEAEAERRSLERSSRLRLATAWESLTKYDQQANARGEISLAEFTRLAELRELIERLYEKYSPK